MEEALQTLKTKRTRTLLVNLLYFTALLCLGVLLFLMNLEGALYLLAAACVACYLLLVRPWSRRYVRGLREEILRRGLFGGLEDFQYEPKGGVTAEQVQASGLVPAGNARAFLSREHVTGCRDGVRVELADVTFPIREDGLNAMFTGCYVCLHCPGAQLPSLTVKGGSRAGIQLPKRQMELLEQACTRVPGSLYLRMEGERAELLLRGRFLGFRLNPLMQLTQETLHTSPLPEADRILELVRLMTKGTRPV